MQVDWVGLGAECGGGQDQGELADSAENLHSLVYYYFFLLEPVAREDNQQVLFPRILKLQPSKSR